MGFLVTLLLSIAFGVLGAVRPRAAFFIILGLFVFFEELGPGFTTYRGSFVFNPYFVGFYGLRLIEVLTISAYVPFLMFGRKPIDAATAFRTEQMMVVIFLTMLAALVSLEFALTRKVQWASFRLILTGAMLFHMLVLLFRNEDEVIRLVRVFLAMLALAAAFGLVMWAAGYGQMTPRGRLPFFHDSKQVEAFALGAAMLTTYLVNYNSLDDKYRIIPTFWAAVILVILAAAVVGSIRRSVWVVTALSMFILIMLSRRTSALHYFVIVFLVAATLGGVLFVPGLDDFRDHMGRYVASMNLMSESERDANIENRVHIKNVEQYAKMLTENPDILLFGIHGPSGVRMRDLLAEYSDEGPLGTAHNGPIRTVLFFGVTGLLLYFAMILVTVSRMWSVFWRAPEQHVLKHIAMACGLTLFLDFAATMAFVPPFYTTSKGLFYAFLQIFILGFVAHHLVRRRTSTISRALKGSIQGRGGAVINASHPQ